MTGVKPKRQYTYAYNTALGERIIHINGGVYDTNDNCLYSELVVETKMLGARTKNEKLKAVIAISQGIINNLINRDSVVTVYGIEKIGNKEVKNIFIVGKRVGKSLEIRDSKGVIITYDYYNIDTLKINKELMPKEYLNKLIEVANTGLLKIQNMDKELGVDTYKIHDTYMKNPNYAKQAERIKALFNNVEVIGYTYDETLEALTNLADAVDNLKKHLNTKVHDKLEMLTLNKNLDSEGKYFMNKISIKLEDSFTNTLTLYHEYGHFLHNFYIKETTANVENDTVFKEMVRKLRKLSTIDLYKDMHGTKGHWTYFNREDEIVARIIESYMYFKVYPDKHKREQDLHTFKNKNELDTFIQAMMKIRL